MISFVSLNNKNYVLSKKWNNRGPAFQSNICAEINLEICLFYCCTDYNFGINCGGPEIRSSNGIIYESDNETLGPATYYVSSTNRWAVSNVGYFTGNRGSQYTRELALFQTTRLSASSLRYYGLGLENGVYNVELQFAETAFLNSASWKNVGSRVFDIYIQVSII